MSLPAATAPSSSSRQPLKKKRSFPEFLMEESSVESEKKYLSSPNESPSSEEDNDDDYDDVKEDNAATLSMWQSSQSDSLSPTGSGLITQPPPASRQLKKRERSAKPAARVEKDTEKSSSLKLSRAPLVSTTSKRESNAKKDKPKLSSQGTDDSNESATAKIMSSKAARNSKKRKADSLSVKKKSARTDSVSIEDPDDPASTIQMDDIVTTSKLRSPRRVTKNGDAANRTTPVRATGSESVPIVIESPTPNKKDSAKSSTFLHKVSTNQHVEANVVVDADTDKGHRKSLVEQFDVKQQNRIVIDHTRLTAAAAATPKTSLQATVTQEQVPSASFGQQTSQVKTATEGKTNDSNTTKSVPNKSTTTTEGTGQLKHEQVVSSQNSNKNVDSCKQSISSQASTKLQKNVKESEVHQPDNANEVVKPKPSTKASNTKAAPPTAKATEDTTKPVTTIAKQTSPSNTQQSSASSTQQLSNNETTAAVAAPKKKKGTLQDNVLQHMLLAFKPFTLKTLAQEVKKMQITEIALEHLMLSLVDKNFVVKKEIISGKGRSTTLYWGNHDVKAKEISLLMATPSEIDEVRSQESKVSHELAVINTALSAVLQTPSNDDLVKRLESDQQRLVDLRQQVDDMKKRIQMAEKQDTGKKTLLRGPAKSAAQLARERCPRRTKIRINNMRSEWKTRKEKCMDFIDHLADGMEKKPKDVIKLLDLETDEAANVTMPPKHVVE